MRSKKFNIILIYLQTILNNLLITLLLFSNLTNTINLYEKSFSLINHLIIAISDLSIEKLYKSIFF